MSILKRLFAGTYVRGFVTIYALFTLVGALILFLPISQQSGSNLQFVDALFVSVSGMSTTGLSTIVVADVLNRFGQTVLAFIIQFGGIGLVMLIGFFWLATGRNIGYKERQFIVTDQNQVKTSQVVKLIRDVLIVLFSVELIMFVVIATYLSLKGYFPVGESIYQAFFLTISLTANAGFDITGDSLVRYANDYPFQLMAMFLMFVGAVGFWPLVEFKDWLGSKNKKNFEFSLFTKILVIMHISLWLFGALMFYAMEAENFLVGKSAMESIFYSLFMSLTTRNAGFSTMDVTALSGGVLLLFSGLMFVGSSPNSAGGGIRTSTFLLVIAAFISFSQEKHQVVLAKKGIKQNTVYKSIIVFNFAISLIFVASMLLLIFDNVSFMEAIFEVASAFGTTGLSLGITPHLSVMSKLVIIATMFIGRIGIVALLLIFNEKDNLNKVKYPEIDLIVG